MDSLAKKIADAIGKYHVGFMQKKVLKTIEEIEATTDPLEKYITGAGPVDELYNNLMEAIKVIKWIARIRHHSFNIITIWYG